MTDKQTRSALREQLVKMAKDHVVHQLAQLYLLRYRSKLENLGPDDHVPEDVPIGKDKFVTWVKEMLSGAAPDGQPGKAYFPEVSGVIENAPILKQYAIQIADEIGKSNTSVPNPMKDYEPKKEKVYVRKAAAAPEKKEKGSKGIYDAPTLHSRHCPEHPGAMLRRVSDKVYQCPIEGSIYTNAPWKEHYSYAGGHEVKFETGVQNQTNPAWNKMHPLPSFLDLEPAESGIETTKGKDYDYEKLYDVFEEKEDLISPSAPASDKDIEAELLAPLTRKGQALFGPTTMTTRTCPDHPGQQLVRMEDSVRQCGLDGKLYDYNVGFETYDGEKHNGGSVQAQMSIPPGSIIVRLDKEAELADGSLSKIAARPRAVAPNDSQRVTQFLYQVLQYLPADSKERQILNYKFSNQISLEGAMNAIEEHERLKTQVPQEQPVTVQPPAATAGGVEPAIK